MSFIKKIINKIRKRDQNKFVQKLIMKNVIRFHRLHRECSQRPIEWYNNYFDILKLATYRSKIQRRRSGEISILRCQFA